MLWRPGAGRQNAVASVTSARAAFRSGPCHAPSPYPSRRIRASVLIVCAVTVVLIFPPCREPLYDPRKAELLAKIAVYLRPGAAAVPGRCTVFTKSLQSLFPWTLYLIQSS